jgi:hypothetical protein
MIWVRHRQKKFCSTFGVCKLLPKNAGKDRDYKAIVGLQAKLLSWLGEGEDFLAAYHDLHRQVLG